VRREARAALGASTRFQDLHARAVLAPIVPFYLEAHDKLAASHDIDHRHPFFDARLIRLCLALPAEQRLSDGWDRVIERRAFEGLCPEPIRARQSKSVWTSNFQRQLLEHNRAEVRAAAELSPHPLAGVVDLDAFRRSARELSPGASADRVLSLWVAVTLTRWFERNSVTL
jgi:asparagine synthase (glutamine-hydrolysing)